MKGFYITVKNGLLDPKHFIAMGGDKDKGTIWLFLWLLDRMTLVDEEKGEGSVNGGRPIKFEEFEKEIPVSKKTYQRWVRDLRESGYIKTKRTPYGLIVTVFKASKIFGQKVRRVSKDASVSNREVSKDASYPPVEDASNYNSSINNKDNTPKRDSRIKELINHFHDLCISKLGVKPVFNGKDGQMLKIRLREMGTEEIRMMFQDYMDDPKAKEFLTVSSSLSAFRVNKFRASQVRGNDGFFVAPKDPNWQFK